MAINLQKGQNIKLDKAIKKVRLGLGWNVRQTTGAAFDLDAWAFLLNDQTKCMGDGNCVYFNNLKSACGSVTHGGDNRTGAGEGDDETIDVDLEKVPATVQRLHFTVSIHEGKERSQNFGQVTGAYIRLLNLEGNKEELRFDLTEDGGTVTSLIFAELYRHDGGWKFRAIGQGYQDGLVKLLQSYGLSV